MDSSVLGSSSSAAMGYNPLSRAGRGAFITDPGLAAEASVASAGGAPPSAGSAGAAADESFLAFKSTAGVTEENQATLLLKKRKDMRMVEDALEVVKREFRERMERLAERQLRFEEKQRGLQEMVAKFKPFLAEVRFKGHDPASPDGSQLCSAAHHPRVALAAIPLAERCEACAGRQKVCRGGSGALPHRERNCVPDC